MLYTIDFIDYITGILETGSRERIAFSCTDSVLRAKGQIFAFFVTS